MKKSYLIIAIVVLAVVGVLIWRANDHRPVIAVVTLMSHPALDALSQECVKELHSLGYTEPRVRFVYRNANGQPNDAIGIAASLKLERPDAIVAITTPMAQAVVATEFKVPVIFGAVTDPVGAKLVQSLEGKGNGLVTGTSDAWPYDGQLKLIREILPQLRRLGVLYNPAEAASQYGIRKIREFAPRYGIELVEAPVNSTGEVLPVAEGLISRCDALFLSSDNTVIGGSAAAVSVAVQHKKPLFVGDSGTVANGGLAAVSVGYAELGRATARLVDRALRGERDLPVHVSEGDEIHINVKAAELMGITIPASVLGRAKQVYREITR